MIYRILNKIGLISKKKLRDVLLDLRDVKNNTSNAHNAEDFYYRCGNSNACNYILSKFAIEYRKRE